MRVAALLLLLLVACTQPRSARCKEICKREGDCIDQVPAKQQTFDEKECVAACSALETDNENVAKVARHADCVQRSAQSCSAVLECP